MLRFIAVSLLVFVGCALSISILQGCESTSRTSDTDLTVLGVDEYLELLAQYGDRTVIIDVRPPSLYAQGHLPDAINIPLPQIKAGDPRLIEAERYVVYGKGWDDVVSPAAAKKMIVLGYSNVYDFRAGFEVWKLQAREIVVPGGSAQSEKQ